MRSVAALAAVLLVFALPAAPARAQGPPSLRLLGYAPVTVQGRDFRTLERVRVAVLAPGRRSMTVRTGAAGSFTARFTNLIVDRCTSLQVQAVGARGDHALLKVRPLCPPP